MPLPPKFPPSRLKFLFHNKENILILILWNNFTILIWIEEAAASSALKTAVLILTNSYLEIEIVE